MATEYHASPLRRIASLCGQSPARRCADAKGVKPLEISAAAKLQNAHERSSRVQGIAKELKDAVRHRELGETLRVLIGVFTNEEHGGLERRE